MHITLNKNISDTKTRSNVWKFPTRNWNFPIIKQVFKNNVMPFLDSNSAIIDVLPSLGERKARLIVRNGSLCFFKRTMAKGLGHFNFPKVYTTYKEVNALSPYISKLTLEFEPSFQIPIHTMMTIIANMLSQVSMLRSLTITGDYIPRNMSYFNIITQLTTLRIILGNFIVAPLQTTHLTFRNISVPNPDTCVLNISKLTDLKSIDCDGGAATDNFLESISGLKKLKYLNLQGSLVTDDGFKYVKDMEYLTPENTCTDYCKNIKTFRWLNK